MNYLFFWSCNYVSDRHVNGDNVYIEGANINTLSPNTPKARPPPPYKHMQLAQLDPTATSSHLSEPMIVAE